MEESGMKNDKITEMNKSAKFFTCWGPTDALSAAYHDHRWCRPLHNDQELFAMLILEGQQAGLSWSLILRREKDLRQAYDNFNPVLVAAYTDARLEELHNNLAIIRNKLKIRSARNNARHFLEIQEKFGSFDSYIWSFTQGEVVDHHLGETDPMPTENSLSQQISRDLKKRGFTFVGPTIIYSYLQGIGLINDHRENCPSRLSQI